MALKTVQCWCGSGVTCSQWRLHDHPALLPKSPGSGSANTETSLEWLTETATSVSGRSEWPRVSPDHFSWVLVQPTNNSVLTSFFTELPVSQQACQWFCVPRLMQPVGHGRTQFREQKRGTLGLVAAAEKGLSYLWVAVWFSLIIV